MRATFACPSAVVEPATCGMLWSVTWCHVECHLFVAVLRRSVWTSPEPFGRESKFVRTNRLLAGHALGPIRPEAKNRPCLSWLPPVHFVTDRIADAVVGPRGIAGLLVTISSEIRKVPLKVRQRHSDMSVLSPPLKPRAAGRFEVTCLVIGQMPRNRTQRPEPEHRPGLKIPQDQGKHLRPKANNPLIGRMENHVLDRR